jgi:hypothetical protein
MASSDRGIFKMAHRRTPSPWKSITVFSEDGKRSETFALDQTGKLIDQRFNGKAHRRISKQMYQMMNPTPPKPEKPPVIFPRIEPDGYDFPEPDVMTAAIFAVPK